MPDIVYINTHAATFGWYFGRRLPDGYRWAAKFWGSGLLDRSRTLYTGFPTQSLYPLLPHRVSRAQAQPTLGELCDAEGARIVAEAEHSQRDIQILWSGGIDSTAALVALIKAAKARDCIDRLEVLLTDQSITEYGLFFDRFVRALRHRFVDAPVTAWLNPQKLIVTGEHGDQIFGSAKAAHYVADGRAFEGYADELPRILAESLGSASKADTVLRYLEPLFQMSPVPLHSVFDVFWWVNFTLKWQIVGLRLAVFRVKDVRQTFNALRHFFSSPGFQNWSLENHHRKIAGTWESYKMPLKDYIFEFTGDDEYRRTKVKLPSLKAIFIADVRQRAPAYRVLMDEDFVPVFWQVDAGRGSSNHLNIPRRNRGR